MGVVKYLMTRYYELIIQALVQHRDISSLIGKQGKQRLPSGASFW